MLLACRGWGGAAGEDGDAEEDEDEEDEDEDEDQDDEDRDDSSSEGSQLESDWTSPHTAACSMQAATHSPSAQFYSLAEIGSSCSQYQQFQLSDQQTSTFPSPILQNSQQFCRFHSACDLCISNLNGLSTKTFALASHHMHFLPAGSSFRCKSVFREHDAVTFSPSNHQQGYIVRQKGSLRKQQHVSWNRIPDFAIRLCLNLLGSCL